MRSTTVETEKKLNRGTTQETKEAEVTVRENAYKYLCQFKCALYWLVMSQCNERYSCNTKICCFIRVSVVKQIQLQSLHTIFKQVIKEKYFMH